jgi:hypothetical protein
MPPNRESGPQNQPSPKVAVSIFDGIKVSIRGNAAACGVVVIVFFFLSENSAAGEGHEVDPLTACPLFRACAYKTTPAGPGRLITASRNMNTPHLMNDVFTYINYWDSLKKL